MTRTVLFSGVCAVFILISLHDLWSSYRAADVFYLSRLINRGGKVAPEVVSAYAIKANGLVEGNVCRSDIVNANLTLILEDLARQNSFSDFDRWADRMQAADRFLVHAISCFPTNGNFWIRLAMVRFVSAEEPEELARLMTTSQWFAPAEKKVLTMRLELWRRVSALTLANADDAVRQDVLTALNHLPPREVVTLLSKPLSDAFRIYLVDAMETLGRDRRKRLENAGLRFDAFQG